MRSIGLLVGAIMHGHVIYRMTFKPAQTCRYDFLQTEEYLLKQSGSIAEYWNHAHWHPSTQCACADSG